MLYGVFSDIHSNIEALSVVLDYFAAQKVEGYICCGDLVGYGPDPEPCLARIRSLKNLSIICGNHDLAAIGRLDAQWFNPYARAAVIWNGNALSEDSRNYIGSLTARLETPQFTVAHGSPRHPVEEYLLSPLQFKDNISRVHVWPLFIGHSHMPLCFTVPVKETVPAAGPEALAEAGARMKFLEDGETAGVVRMPYGIVPTAFNPGSVGQPRDQDKRACCGLYDSEKGEFKITRLEYDIPAVQAKIRQAGLPEFLALRLAYGQ